MNSQWLPEEHAQKRLSATADDITALVESGELTALQLPSGRRIHARSLKAFERAVRSGYVSPVRIGDLPPANMRVGSWVLPSGRSLELSLGAPENGVRRLTVFYDHTAPLSDEDRRALDEYVLPEAAEKIQRLTGRRGVGLIALPVPPGTA